MQTFLPATTIRHTEVDGLRIILDLNVESYLILDDTASEFWSVLMGEVDLASSLSDLVERFDVDEDRLRTEFAKFTERCLVQGLLTHPGAIKTEATSVSSYRWYPSRLRTFGALVCLIATARLLAKQGFRKTYEKYSQLPVGPHAPSLSAVIPGFTRAENLFIARRAPGDCLVRSLSLYRYLRSVNIPAEHIIGVRRFPFGAHAWVEYHGSPLLDNLSGQFKPLARIGQFAVKRANRHEEFLWQTNN